jgi:hypothetical protein
MHLLSARGFLMMILCEANEKHGIALRSKLKGFSCDIYFIMPSLLLLL